ncbi:MAG TPA: ferric reductase-like transmembrane domain-containing protein [Gemmatimonadaceae bacterium]|nr:ferric reductase-like transmembrane domain-containing protein [Gemmatimonadaceae bacterium]
MTPLDLSSDVALVALCLLTANVLLGLLLSMHYNPWKHWPHRRFNYFKLHNWNAYLALALALLHAVLLLAVKTPAFRFLDIIYPVTGPKQPWINTIGAGSLYVLLMVVISSYYRVRLGRGNWKLLHYLAYVAAALFFVHGILTDPTLKDRPIDYLDGEKVLVEVCALLVLSLSLYRLRWGLRRRSAQQVRTAPARAA